MSSDGIHHRTSTTPDNTNKVLCIGVAALDTIATIQTFPKPDDKLRSESILTSGGGNAANTAVALSRMISSNIRLPNHSISVDLLSAVGDDANGDTIVKELTSQGVGVEMMERYTGVSPWCYIMVETSQNTRTCIFQPGSAELSTDHIRRTLIQIDANGDDGDDDNDDGAGREESGRRLGEYRAESGRRLGEYRAAHFDGRYIEGSLYLAKQLTRRSIPYSVDVERPRGGGFLELLRGASIIICNSNYCRLSLGLDDEEEGAFDEREVVANLRRVLREQAPNAQVGVTTLGSRGSCLIFPEEEGVDDRRIQKGTNNLDGGGAAAAGDTTIVLETHDNYPNSPRVMERHGALWCDAWKNCTVIDTTGAGDVFQGAFLATLWSHAASVYHNSQEETTTMTTTSTTNESRMVPPPPFKVPVEKSVLTHALRIGTRVAGLKLNGMGPRAAFPASDKFIESELGAVMMM